MVQGAYFLMNCITFIARFLFFHYVLFAKNRAAGDDGPAAAIRRRPDLATAEAPRRQRHRPDGAGLRRLGAAPPTAADGLAGAG